ncbi:hypothetical protein Gogos_005379 [Gossypium gossypioides]|uniref:Uncharacterized protein n=1 Tax=Gossypium gossypioides TaxID=34282 RepID=A0A7J9D053_GOSGO|nr:hypothetical protein [Gossypium gossypioides]
MLQNLCMLSRFFVTLNCLQIKQPQPQPMFQKDTLLCMMRRAKRRSS